MLGLLPGGLCFIGSGGDVLYLKLGLLHGGSGEVETFVSDARAVIWRCMLY